MRLSIIIPTYNEQDVILNCLHSLERQSYNDFEVIVVDDGSYDNTLKLLSDFRTKRFSLKVLKQAHKGAGAGRNLGVSKASGDILVFVDADMIFDKNFLKMLTKPIISGKTSGTFSKDEYVANWDNIWARCWNINEGWQSKKRHPKNYPDHQSVFRAIKKSEFEKVSGFTPGGYNDDWSLSRKLGYEAEVSPKAIFYHKNPSSLPEVFAHAQWVGKRAYKFGVVGYMIGLLRSSLPVSIIVGVIKSFLYAAPLYLIFKIVYDFGVFIGIIKFSFTKKGAK